MPKKHRIDDIARAAFVSRSVVSRVLNNRPNVSPEARARVQAVIEEFGYTPSSAARSLALNKTFEISIIAPRRKDHVFANAFWALIFLGLSETCIRRGYFATLNVLSGELDPVLKHRILRERSKDGYVMIGHEVAQEALEVIEQFAKPAVLIGRDLKNPHVHSVDLDNHAGAFKAVDYLIRLGHRRIGLIAGRIASQEALDRVEGYKAAHRQHELETDPSLIFDGEFSQQAGYKCMQRLLLYRPTAVFCTSDAQASGAMLAIWEAGLKMPQDISVMGFDDLPSARFHLPPLTTVRQPIYTIGAQASNMLIDLIEDEGEVPPRLLLQPTLVVRSSCAAPAS